MKLDSQLRRVLATKFGGSEAEEDSEVAATKLGFVVPGRTTSTDLPARANSISGSENGYVGFVSETADIGVQVLRKTNQHRVTVTNFGKENATSVRLAGLFTNSPITAISVPCSIINIGAASNLDCDLGTLFKNEAKVVMVTAANPVKGTFSVSSSLIDPNGANNQP